MADKVKVQFEIDAKLALRALQNVNRAVDGFEKKASKNFKSFGSKFDIFVGNLAAQGAVRALSFITQSFESSFNASKDFETGLVEIAKTSNLTEKELRGLSKEIDELTKIIPVTSKELLTTAKVAGQLGVVGSKDILKFAATIAKLGKVSNLEGEAAASTLARILNITGEANSTIDVLASVIVSLGNNFAATESEIARVTNEIARATQQFKVSSGEAAALAATLRAIGVRAEEAGTVISKTFLAIQGAVKLGGKNLKQLEIITGDTGEELKKQFGEDAIGVFEKFILGLGRMQKEGAVLRIELSRIGLSGARLLKVIPPLTENIDEFRRAMVLQSAEVVNATALEVEFARALSSTDSQMQLFNNSVVRLQKGIGDNLTGAFKKISPFITDFITQLSETPIETFARKSSDIGELTNLMEILRNSITRINASGKISFFEIDPEKLADDIGTIQRKIALINTQEAAATITKLKDELISLRDIDIIIPGLRDLIPGVETVEERIKTIKEQLKNLKDFINLQNGDLLKIEQAKTDAEADALRNRFDILEEIRAAQKEREKEDIEAEKLAKEAQDTEEFQILESNLGRAEAARILFRAKQLAAEKKIGQARKLISNAITKVGEKNAKKLEATEKKIGQAKLRFQVASANALIALSGVSGKAQFLLQQAVAFGQAIVLGRVASAQALASGPPAVSGPAVLAVEKLNAFNLATIAAAGIGEFATRFQHGGFQTGPRVGDKNNISVNGDEAILKPSQQRRFLDIANGTERGSNNPGLADALNNLAEAVLADKVTIIDGREIFRSVQNELDSGAEFSTVGAA